MTTTTPSPTPAPSAPRTGIGGARVVSALQSQGAVITVVLAALLVLRRSAVRPPVRDGVQRSVRARGRRQVRSRRAGHDSGDHDRRHRPLGWRCRPAGRRGRRAAERARAARRHPRRGRRRHCRRSRERAPGDPAAPAAVHRDPRDAAGGAGSRRPALARRRSDRRRLQRVPGPRVVVAARSARGRARGSSCCTCSSRPSSGGRRSGARCWRSAATRTRRGSWACGSTWSRPPST